MAEPEKAAPAVQPMHKPLEGQHPAMLQAQADTALPRHWPAWAALLVALAVAVSHFAPWGFAPTP